MSDPVLQPGEVVDRYVAERKLGAGGMAEVWLVRHESLRTLHALKVLTLTGPTLHARLMQEGQVQARLHHPNLVHVSDVITVKGLPALVMEYVDGPHLGQWLRDQKPDPATAEQVFRGIVAGVAAAHEGGVIHRDLKPANVFLARDAQGRWQPKIGDFGLTKVSTPTSPVEGGPAEGGHTKAGLPMGTPQYMAPEQIRDAANVDRRADVFALGCILYELLSHQAPYGGTDLMDIFGKVSSGERAPLPPTIPARLQAVVDWCLEIEPDDRPADCAAILRGLAGQVPRRSDETGTPLQLRFDLPFRLPFELPFQLPTSLPVPVPVVVLAAAAGSLFVLLVLTVTIVALSTRDDGALGELAQAELPTCPTEGGRLGWVRTPPVFEKPIGSTWTLAEHTVVVASIPSDPIQAGAGLCELPAGAQVKVTEGRVVGSVATWLPVDAHDVVQLPATPLEEPDGEVAGERCDGVEGELLGWFHTRLARPLDRAPRDGGTWKLDKGKYVHRTHALRGSERGDVVCAIPGGTTVEITGEVLSAGIGKGFWIPVVAGALD